MDQDKYQKTLSEITFACNIIKDIDLDGFVQEIQRADVVVISPSEFKKKTLLEEIAVRMRLTQRSYKLLQDFLSEGAPNGEGSDHT